MGDAVAERLTGVRGGGRRVGGRRCKMFVFFSFFVVFLLVSVTWLVALVKQENSSRNVLTVPV